MLKSILKNYGICFSFLIIGLIFFTYPMLMSGFDLMPGHMSDAKFINYILEFLFSWLKGLQNCDCLWNAPFYYPRENTLIYSDAMIGVAPIYSLFRFVWSPLSAFQATFIALCTLNYITFYYLLKKQLKMSNLASSVGAFLFAFSLMRFFRTIHLQHFPQFFEILTLIFLLKVNIKNSVLKNNIYFLLATLFLSIQFYTCVSLGYFFVLIGFFFIAFCFCFKNSRSILISYFKNFWKYIIPYFILFIISLLPLVLKYHDLDEIRSLEEVMIYLQDISCWFRNVSILDNLFFDNLPYINFAYCTEISASIGIFATILSIYGIFKYKNIRYPLFITLILIVLISCKVGEFFLWQYLYNFLPGASGIRAIIRISFIALIIFSIGLACYIDYLQKNCKNKFKNIFLIISILLIVIEAIPYTNDKHSAWRTYCWSKSAFYEQLKEAEYYLVNSKKVVLFRVNRLNENKDYLYKDTNNRYTQGLDELEKISLIDFSTNLLAMWSTLLNGKYTLNGYTGVIRDPMAFYEFYDVNTFYFNFDLSKFSIENYFLKNKKF